MDFLREVCSEMYAGQVLAKVVCVCLTESFLLFMQLVQQGIKLASDFRGQLSEWWFSEQWPQVGELALQSSL